jgi:lipopolysaccharide transport system permease protein
MQEAVVTGSAPPAWEIEPGHAGPIATLGEVWRHRRLLRFIGSRALRKIYRRTVLGWAWLFIIPLLPIALRTIIFGGLLDVPSSGVPYLLFLTGGTVVWDVFALGLTWGTRGLEMNRGVAEQVYVPGAVLTFGNMTPAFLDFALKLAAFLLMTAVFTAVTGTVPIRFAMAHWAAAAVALALLLAAALSLFTSVWGEAGRDTRFVLGQVLGIWYLFTPVLYPLSATPVSWRPWLEYNPMLPIVETFKWALFGAGAHDPAALAKSAALIAGLGVVGLFYFSRHEAAASDAR